MRILVTGASGFVGRVLCPELVARGASVRVALRSPVRSSAEACERVVVGDIDSRTDWTEALQGVDCVLHLAARAHILDQSRGGPQPYFDTNALGTHRLAQAAVRAGVKRLVYLSSIKVNGEGRDAAYLATDTPQPMDAYGTSKWQGEQHLHEIAAASSMEAVVIRSPLVYGPQVRANFLRLMKWVDKGVPLPLGAVRNRRSIVSVWNLADLLYTCVSSPAAAGGTFMVSDSVDLSTPELIRRIGVAMDRRVRLIPVPVLALRAAGALLGRRADIERLCGSLAVELGPTCATLSWRPPHTIESALGRTVEWYLKAGRDAPIEAATAV
ncbi:MAG: NAD-dependent epimerase/dehydratase family protein [Gammaproteobacteria bacterium]